MPSFKKTAIPAALTLLLIAPLVGASAAHPHPHTYVGTSLNSVYLNVETDNANFLFTLDSAVVGLCLDGSPFLKTFLPPEPVRDGDTDVGVGGSCFAFETVYGNDAGSTLTVSVQESISSGLKPVWVACVDVNGDGTCSAVLNEPYNVCTNGPSGAYSISDPLHGPCTVYADPDAIVNPAVHVLMIGGLSVDGTTITPNVATAGNIFVA